MLTTSGFAGFLGGLSELEDRITGDRERWIGTTTPYAHIPEFGSSHQGAEPYFRPGLRIAARTPGNLSDAFWEGRALEQLADRAVDAIQGEIAARGLIETGDLHDSIAQGRTQSEAARKSDAAR